MHNKRIVAFTAIILALNTSHLQAQSQPADTLKLTVKEAEERFIKKNLQLIVAHYNIDNAQAQVITTRLFPNPDLNISNVLYNKDTKKVLDFSRGGGEYTVGLSQLFTTAGKRNKNIKLAQLSVELARDQFFDLLRTLKLTVRDDFFTIYFQQESAKVYDQEISSLNNILIAYKEQYAKGTIAEKEVLRIQSQLYSLQAELASLLVNIASTQAQLNLLIGMSPSTILNPVYNYDLDGKKVLSAIPYRKLLDSAYVNRYDLQAARSTIDYNNLNLRLQKSIAVPDFTVGLSYDKQASYIKDYTGVSIDFPLPFFNRNQGGIKQARIAIDQGKVQLENQQNQVESDVASNYTIALQYENTYNSFDQKFKGDFTHLIGEVFINYKKRNISLLEFLDFYDSYKVNAVQLNSVQLNRVTSLEQLNFVTGTPFFN